MPEAAAGEETARFIDPSTWKTSPFHHQVEGVEFLLNHPRAALFDEPGAGKSGQFVVTASLLHRWREIDVALVICPAGVRATWRDPEVGEIQKHCLVPHDVYEYHSGSSYLPAPESDTLRWVVTNYEFIRQAHRLEALLDFIKGKRIFVVFDESSYIKSHKALQTRACFQLSKFCKYRYLGNGTPTDGTIVDLYSQFAVIDKAIIGCDNFYQYRNRYLTMGGYKNKQITGYRNIEELQRRIKPYALRRLKEDCLDLPPKLYTTYEKALSEPTWRLYKQMRDEMVMWLDKHTPVMSAAAVVKIVRLSQLTSGIAGGLLNAAALFQQVSGGELVNEEVIDDLAPPEDTRVVSSEKHDWAVDWMAEQVELVPNFRTIFWTRFRIEQLILQEKLLAEGYDVLRIYGGQSKPEREETIRAFNRPNKKPVALLGQPRAGGIGLNLQAECSWAVYVSSDYSLLNRIQSEDRIHRPGQKASVVNYIDVLATGPQGQKTIDHVIKRALSRKDKMATWTSSYWRAALLEE